MKKYILISLSVPLIIIVIIFIKSFLEESSKYLGVYKDEKTKWSVEITENEFKVYNNKGKIEKLVHIDSKTLVVNNFYSKGVEIKDKNCKYLLKKESSSFVLYRYAGTMYDGKMLELQKEK